MKKKDNKIFDSDEFLEMWGMNAITDLLMGKPKAIKGISDISRQKKEKRLVINLPEWLKGVLEKKSQQTGMSMNEIVRIALTEYLSKEKK